MLRRKKAANAGQFGHDTDDVFVAGAGQKTHAKGGGRGSSSSSNGQPNNATVVPSGIVIGPAGQRPQVPHEEFEEVNIMLQQRAAGAGKTPKAAGNEQTAKKTTKKKTKKTATDAVGARKQAHVASLMAFVESSNFRGSNVSSMVEPESGYLNLGDHDGSSSENDEWDT